MDLDLEIDFSENSGGGRPLAPNSVTPSFMQGSGSSQILLQSLPQSLPQTVSPTMPQTSTRTLPQMPSTHTLPQMIPQALPQATPATNFNSVTNTHNMSGLIEKTSPKESSAGQSKKRKREVDQQEEERKRIEEKKRARKEAQNELLSHLEESERKRFLESISQFSEEQKARYEKLLHANFPVKTVKAVIKDLLGSTKVGGSVPVALAGATKLFVGDMIEQARIIMNETGDIGPTRPVHIREALNRLKQSNKLISRSHKSIFSRR